MRKEGEEEAMALTCVGTFRTLWYLTTRWSKFAATGLLRECEFDCGTAKVWGDMRTAWDVSC